MTRSTGDLQAAINRYIAEHHAEPMPLGWTADPRTILNKLRAPYGRSDLPNRSNSSAAC